MIYVLFACVLASHVWATRSFVVAAKRRLMPRPVDFAMASFLIYYDIELIAEVLGFRYLFPGFAAFFFDPDTASWIVLFLIGAAPWALKAGAKLLAPSEAERPRPKAGPGATLRWRPAFYAFLPMVCIPLLLLSHSQLAGSATIADVRYVSVPALGQYLIVLYIPLGLLAFYVRERDATTRVGTLIAIGLAAVAIYTTLPVGERTLALLPLLVLFGFRARLSIRRAIGAATVLVLVAVVLVSVFKSDYVTGGNTTVSDSATYVMSADLGRGPIADTVVNLSNPLGTKLLPYPGAGYVYSALYYVPRTIAPFKGYSSGAYFTGNALHADPGSDLGFSYAFGTIEELALNFGYALVLPLLVLVGMLLSAAERASRRVPSLLIPTRLGALWLCSFDSSSQLLLFGSMAVTCLILHAIFSRPLEAVSEVETGSGPRAGLRPLPSAQPRVQTT